MRAVASVVRAGARAAAPAFSAERSVLARNMTVLAARNATKAVAPVAVQCRHFAKKTAEEPDLHSLLLSEADYEAHNAEIDQEFEEVKKKVLKNFKLKSKLGQGTVELVGSHGSETVTITFDCQDEIDTSDFTGEDIEIEQNEGDEDEFGGSQGINFLVEVDKKGEKMLFGCIAADTNDVLISQVRHVPTGESAEESESYGGPMVETLDPELTQLMTEYLAERKVDADMSYFIGQYAQQKESEEYVNFCRKFAEFVNK